MILNKTQFTELIKTFKFKELFKELGWDKASIVLPVSIDEQLFTLTAVAEKRGFLIFVCSPDPKGKIPTKDIRKKIDNKIAKLYYEHLIIYSDKNNSHQIWQLVIRELDKPLIVRETDYFPTQHPELLFQRLRGIFVSLDDEDKVTITDVRTNVREQFNTNAEKVTKKFYTEFKAQHTVFLKFIEGIEDKVSQEWYASLMLNRLMFIYFIQKKGFLDNNINYLHDKLKETKKKKGDNKFFSFYRNFLLVLFHQGLGSPVRNEKLLKEIGKVPYLNGGLFDVHKIEKDFKKIEIEDKAFEKIFKFFDEYNWHLDNKITATGRDINPDVIGYIFEKYINDRAAMGAYYTKEDITEYIAKNTVIPYLFDQVKKDCANAFKNESRLWKMLQENPDRYIYDSVKHGIYEEVIANEVKQSQFKIRELPDFISIGLNTTKPNLLERRKEWNKAAPTDFALPTEIWREVVERRNRYFDIKSKVENGEIKEINNFITYNLNIRQFAQDAVQQYEGSDFINAFYKAITKITVLDPTCGSGAFLFAALNILEPLYYTCIERMKDFIEQDDKQDGKKFSQFRKVIEDIDKHPNQQYYIYKSIILNNLYGVDIMNEAVEIAKLRLFLKLVAEVEVDYEKQNMGLEPLPDVDFNVRCGNTLIGFATKAELDKGLTWSLNVGADTKKVYDELDIVAKAFNRYKEIQLEDGTDHEEFKKAKDELNERLKKLNETLNDYLGNDYGKSRKKKKEFEAWLNDYKPFHWFAEFYEIIESEGFDIIIGNPPYIENSKVVKSYLTKNFITNDSGNIYTQVIERTNYLSKNNSFLGFIVPISAVCTDRTESFQKLIHNNFSRWISSFDIFPSRLFEGAAQRLTILLLLKNIHSKSLFVTKYYRWYEIERNSLIHQIDYIENNHFNSIGWLARINTNLGMSILFKLPKTRIVSFLYTPSETIIYVHRIINNFVKAVSFEPYFKKASGEITHSDDFKKLSVSRKYHNIVISILNSNIFYYYWRIHGDGFHCGFKDIEKYPINFTKFKTSDIESLTNLSSQLVKDLKKNSEIRIRNQEKTGRVELQTFFVGKSKALIDEIDKVLAEHYGFTEEELDFIINYDIKYRMGKELEEE